MVPSVGALLLGVLTASAPSAQDGRDPVPEVDPYTENDPAALERAGYVSYGPFDFGDDHTSRHVREVLGGVPLLWVETAHFRLGTSLDTYERPSDRDERKRLDAELARLRERIPNLPRKVRELDSWLLMHLYAQRLEDLYARFSEVLGLDPADFPATSAFVGPKEDPRFDGPYLGMGGKFLVLLCEKESSFGRYAQTYLGHRASAPYRFYHPKIGSAFFGTAKSFLEGGYDNDLAFHCAVVAGVVKNLVNATYGFDFDMPFFWREGLSHWFTREVDPRYPVFTSSGANLTRLRVEENWRPRVRARAGHGAYPKAAAMVAWDDPDALQLADHMILWSRIDHLLALDDGLGGRLQKAFKEVAHDPTAGVLEAGATNPFLPAFTRTVEMSPEELDEAWAAWVKKTYPKR